MKYKRLKMIAYCFSFIGLVFIVYGFLLDPFSLPFQDFEDLPHTSQLDYYKKSNIMFYVRLFGFFLFVCSVSGLLKIRSVDK
jgi:quinol-cytochrome oxidoreductase complex cytochrome b subunit